MDTHILYNTSFILDDRPNLPCPTCSNGLLKIDIESFKYKASEESKKNRPVSKADDYPPDYLEYRFHGAFQCIKCKEIVTVVGTGQISEYYDGEDSSQHINTFYPKLFVPAIPLFKIDRKCPLLVKVEIDAAFNLYWCDLPACANKIRIAVEQIMNDKKVRKVYIPEGKTKERRYDLHARIEMFGKKFPRYKTHVTPLLALKYIGNDGSHVGSLNISDVIVGFELLEEIINQIYGGKNERLENLAKAYSKKK
jgi:hypothetical protein